jgi:hypothetical protein
MIPCLYVASPSYSGSTLLTMLLAAHPEIATIGEMKGGQEDLASYRCSCGTLFVACPFWRELIAAVGRRGFRYDLGDRGTMPAFRAPSSGLADLVLRRPFGSRLYEATRDAAVAAWPWLSREVERLLAYNQAFIEEVLRLSGGRVFVDSSKDGVRIKYLARIPKLEVRVVQLVRDGRAVVNSARKNAKEPADRAAAEWREQHLEIERVARRCCDGRLLRVRYEDLCREPALWAERILGFGGIEGALGVQGVDGSRHHILGNRMRLKGAQTVRVDEGWRLELPKEDEEAFERMAGDLNRRYGYLDPRGASTAPAAATVAGH